MNAAHGAEDGVTQLRRRTLGRALRSYVDWIGRAVGWWTIGYIMFWAVLFAIAGVEMLGRLEEPLDFPLGTLSSLILTGVFGSLVYRARSAPVYVNRRDVYRLVLSPAAPFAVLRWAFLKSWIGRGLAGLAAGALVTLVSPYWFHVTPWFAGPALALILIGLHNLSWVRYWQWGNAEADLRLLLALPAATALALLGVFLPGFGLTGALVSGSPLMLLTPLLLAVGSAVLVHRTLESTYPPRFAAQSFVLSELQAIRQTNLLAAMAGMPASGDPAQRARLLAALHDRPGVTRPRRSLRPPRPGAPQAQAFAWRTLSMLARRPLTAQLRLIIQFVLAGAAALFAPLAGSFGFLLAALVMANLAAFTLGHGNYPKHLPIRPQQRTLGRALPAGIIALTAALASWLLAPVLLGDALPPDYVLLLGTLYLGAVLWTEKYSSWTGTPATRMEAWLLGALLASAPALLLPAFGAPGLVLPLQMGAVFLLLILDV